MRIAIVGKMHAGKTTIAGRLVEQGFQRIAFADPVKDIAAEMLTVFNGYITEDDEPSLYTRADINEMKGQPPIRKFLQLVGTELGREWTGNNNLWIDMFEREVEYSDKTWIVNDDCRFLNEAERLRTLDFLIIKVVRNEEERLLSIWNSLPEDIGYFERRLSIDNILNHASETNVDLIEPDFTLQNDDIMSLETKIEVIVDLARQKAER